MEGEIERRRGTIFILKGLLPRMFIQKKGVEGVQKKLCRNQNFKKGLVISVFRLFYLKKEKEKSISYI